MMSRAITWFGKIVDRFFCLLCAFVFMQVPQFVHQYTLNLQGHVSELQFQVGQMEQVAHVNNKSLTAYIYKFMKSSDSDFAAQGVLMQELVNRFQEMRASLVALQEASVFVKPFYFLKNVDISLVKETWGTFTPGLYTNFESLLYMLAGLLVGYMLISSICCLKPEKNKWNTEAQRHRGDFLT